jgi:predicted GNAT family acetyltransferase
MGINANESEAERRSLPAQSEAADDLIDLVGEASRESFPASDSPAWAMGREAESAIIQVSDNTAENRFEAHAGGNTAFLVYRRMPGRLVLVHTAVPTEFEGHGIGSKLVRAGIEFAREQGLTVVPVCRFVIDYIRRHQEYVDLVHPDYRDRVTQGA